MWQETLFLSIKIMKGMKEVERLKANIDSPDCGWKQVNLFQNQIQIFSKFHADNVH